MTVHLVSIITHLQLLKSEHRLSHAPRITFVNSDRITYVNGRLSTSSTSCGHAPGSQLNRKACRPDRPSTNEARRHNYLGLSYLSSKEAQESTINEDSQTRASQSTPACDVFHFFSPAAASIQTTRTAYPARTASPPDHAASDCDNTTASDSDAHLQSAQQDSHTSSTADCDSTATRAQASPCWETTCALARRRRNPTNATTTPCLSNCDCHQRPATSVHSRHYQRQEVPATLLRQLRHSSAGSRKAISTGQDLQVREDLLDRTTRRRGTNRHRPSLPKRTTRWDPQRRSSRLLPPSHQLRMDTFQGTDVQVPPRVLVELPRQLLGYQATTRRRPPVLHQQGQRSR